MKQRKMEARHDDPSTCGFVRLRSTHSWIPAAKHVKSSRPESLPIFRTTRGRSLQMTRAEAPMPLQEFGGNPETQNLMHLSQAARLACFKRRKTHQHVKGSPMHIAKAVESRDIRLVQDGF